jgi:uncharacterized protein (DUF1501 family)
MTYISRRHLLAGMGATGFAAGFGSLANLSGSRAWAANTTGYKAIVCIFLKGGMDQSDTILPYDQPSYDQLSVLREGLFGTYNAGSETSSRNRANLLKLNPTNASDYGGREFAMPRELAPLHSMFEAGELGIVGNVGPLIEPTTRVMMVNGTALLPPRLFSHNDQQSTWMSLEVEGARSGWGGRFIDAALQSAPSDSPTFSAISTGSNDVFLAGDQARAYRVTGSGAPKPGIIDRQSLLGFTRADIAARERIRTFLNRNNFLNKNIYEQDLRDSNQRAFVNSEIILNAMENTQPFTTTFPAGNVNKQMKGVAETIRIQQFLNTSRQMFLVTTGGYDSHFNQTGSIPGNHETLAEAIAVFREAMIEIGQWDNVLVFTASDFGRTVIGNGNGTDHGWGGHQFVAGGRVQGKRIYGDIPDLDTNGPGYTETRGRLIPTTSVEQYAATMGKWFGLNNEELVGALPNLGNFSQQDLGFMSGGG